MARQPLLIGCGAGFSGDRPDAPEAVVATLSARGGPACLMLETLAERTLALAQLRRRENPMLRKKIRIRRIQEEPAPK